MSITKNNENEDHSFIYANTNTYISELLCFTIVKKMNQNIVTNI